jgi:predicted alpha/beta superfamily hydrolase
MRKFLFSYFFSFLLLQSFAQTNDVLTIGIHDSVYSAILHEQRQLYIHVPKGDANSPLKTRYAVIYLLDGRAYFSMAVSMLDMLSLSGVCPNMIVVSITNTDRQRDFTPTKVVDTAAGQGQLAGAAGGSEQFLAFMEKELIPHIDSAYPTAPYKIFGGHSLSGLEVVYALLTHPHLFNAYIALDPSMWWDNGVLVKKARDVFAKEDFKKITFFLNIANTMPAGLDTATVRADTSALTEHIRNILLLNDIIHNNPQNGLTYSSKYYSNDNHNSSTVEGLYDGLRFIYNFYAMPNVSAAEEFNPSLTTLSNIEKHFQAISARLGFANNPPEDIINELGYNFWSTNKMAEAEIAFNMNIKNYPASFNVFDSAGDFYAAYKNNDKAIDNYKKALAIAENIATRNKLNALLKK